MTHSFPTGRPSDLMKPGTDAGPAEFPNHAVTVLLGMRLNGRADIAEVGAGPDRIDAEPHALVGHVAQALGLDRRLADIEHAAGVAMIDRKSTRLNSSH